MENWITIIPIVILCISIVFNAIQKTGNYHLNRQNEYLHGVVEGMKIDHERIGKIEGQCDLINARLENIEKAIDKLDKGKG